MVIEPDRFDTKENEVWDLGVCETVPEKEKMARSFMAHFPVERLYIGFAVQPIDFEKRTPEMCCLELQVSSCHQFPQLLFFLHLN